MLKNITQFKSVINGVENLFLFDQNCPIEIAKLAVFECLKWIGNLEDQLKSQAEAQAELDKIAEESKVEPEEVPKAE